MKIQINKVPYKELNMKSDIVYFKIFNFFLKSASKKILKNIYVKPELPLKTKLTI